MKDFENNKNRKRVRNILRLYTDRKLPENLEKEVKDWLLSDFHAFEKEEALQDLWDELDVQAAGESNALKAINRKISQNPTKVVSLKKKYLLQIAAVFIPLFIVAGMFYWKGTDKNVEPAPVVIRQLANITGVKYIDAFENTDIWLNENTELVCRDESLMHLNGEAFFNFKNTQNREVVIKTGCLTVTVTGTSFNICAYPDLNETILSLYEGKLKVELYDSLLFLNSMDELVIDQQSETFGLRTVSYSEPEWKRDDINYTNVELRKVLNDLEKIYRVKINGGNTELLNNYVTFKIKKDTPVEEVIYIISQISGGFDYSIEKNIITIF